MFLLRKFHKYKNSIAPLALVISVIAFFAKLFYPESSIFITADFGQSDLFQLNYPAKFALYEALKNNSLPFWNKFIGTGFPQIAEGQIGTFNIVNLFLYKFLPFVQAISIGYISIFVTSALGTYFYIRFLKHDRLTAFFSAFLFAFSGFFVTHMAHINLLQASSFLPWLFLFSHRYIQKKNILDLIIFVLLLAQQFFAGFPQITFIILCGVASLYIYAIWIESFSIKKLVYPIIAIIVFILLVAIQILPSQEFLKFSTRKEGFVLTKATQYSFPWGHFVAFVMPDFFGTPKDGSYPPLIPSRGSIYWENSGYIGVLPLILAALSLVIWKRKKYVRYYWMLLIGSGLLMTGKHSPLYLIFSFFPFNYFRVPSRFILLFIWALVILSAYGLTYLRKKHISTLSAALLVVIGCVQLWLFSYNYNPIGKAAEWLHEPDLSKQLPSNERYFTVGSGLLWNRYFYTSGWTNTTPFLIMNNYVRPNANILYHKDAYQVYPILTSNRYAVINGLLEENIPLNSVDETFETNKISKKILQMNNVGTIVSHYGNDSYKAPFSVDLDEEKIYSYKTDAPLPRARMVYDYKVVETVEALTAEIGNDDFDPVKTVLLESKSSKFTNSDKKNVQAGIVEWRKDTHTEVLLDVETAQDGFLVLADLYFPGWQAAIDGKKTEILPANGSQRAILIPSGKHLIQFVYKPSSFKIGFIITVVAHLLTVLAAFGVIFRSRIGKSSPTR